MFKINRITITEDFNWKWQNLIQLPLFSGDWELKATKNGCIMMRRPQLIWQLNMTMTSMKDSVKQLTTCKSDPHLDCINCRDFSWTHLDPRIDYVSIIPIFYNSRRFKRFNESLTVDLLLYYQVLYKSWPCTHQLCRTLTMTSNDFCTVWMMLVHMLDYVLFICILQ